MLSATRPNRHLLAMAFTLSILPAHACGPDFPLRLLDNRQQTLSEFPETNFAVEVRHLVPTPKDLSPVKQALDWTYEEDESLSPQNQLEKQGLSKEQWLLVKQIRSLTSAQQAEKQGRSLPVELRLYLAGAVAFAQKQDPVAQRYFRQVLALTTKEKPLSQRQLWALYSLARSQMRQGDNQAAFASFSELRQHVSNGAKDELHLGIESLGEEAFFYKQAGHWHQAIDLYARQAALNSASGYASLKLSAQTLINLPEKQLSPLLDDALIQQLVISWLLSHFGEYSNSETMYGDLSNDSKNHYHAVVQLLANNTHIAANNAERLAAITYQNADYSNTEKLLTQAGDGGIAWWLRAKLALRANNISAARQAYAQAAKRFPKEENWGSRYGADWAIENVNPHCRVQGEDAILALHEGDYLEAFDQLWQGRANYWQDAADIAERVLTTDELKKYVDTHHPANSLHFANTDTNQDGKTDGSDDYVALPVELSLRELLGRRLLREGRYDQAVEYFRPERQVLVKAYGEARSAGAKKWGSSDITRAEKLYQAAVLVHNNGIELLGYEMAPDYAIWDGFYQFAAVSTVKQPWQTPAEQQRQLVNTAQPNQRWHYRYTAADLANQAADLLSPRSQAFAVVLLNAHAWLANTDVKAARVYYQRYIKEGAYSATGFANEPDFEQARAKLWTYRIASLRSELRPYKNWIYASPLLVLMLGFIGVMVMKRVKK